MLAQCLAKFRKNWKNARGKPSFQEWVKKLGKVSALKIIWTGQRTFLLNLTMLFYKKVCVKKTSGGSTMVTMMSMWGMLLYCLFFLLLSLLSLMQSEPPFISFLRLGGWHWEIPVFSLETDFIFSDFYTGRTKVCSSRIVVYGSIYMITNRCWLSLSQMSKHT